MNRDVAKIFATIPCRAYNHELQIRDTAEAFDDIGWRRSFLRSKWGG
jgi:hypothetical protein